MSKNHSSFQDLEKQLAKDTLEEALKDLHGEIIEDIDKNKTAFSQEIQKTLANFKKNLEESVSDEMDKKISAHLHKNFSDISTKVTSSFYESSSPFLKRAEEDLMRLHKQGEETLSSWKAMMKQYRSLWNRPFILIALACILTGAVTSIVSTYLLTRDYRRARDHSEFQLSWALKEYFAMKEALEVKTSKPNIVNKAKAQSKKK